MVISLHDMILLKQFSNRPILFPKATVVLDHKPPMWMGNFMVDHPIIDERAAGWVIKRPVHVNKSVGNSDKKCDRCARTSCQYDSTCCCAGYR